MISPVSRQDIWILPLSGAGKPAALVATRFPEIDPQISPDGRWFAYASDESGRFEIYVQSVSGPSNRIRVSTSGGERPRWRPDGKELFFLAGSLLQSVDLHGADTLEAGPAKDLFRLSMAADYTVARDGRILAAVPVDENPNSAATVVLHWDSELPQ